MKIRFGVTLPLVLEDETKAKLLMPHFVSKNFSIPEDLKHVVSVQGKTDMWPLNYALAPTRRDDVFSVAGTISDNELADNRSTIALNRHDVKEVWARDPFNPGFAITQSVTEHTPTHLRRIVVVVDTSATMRPYVPQIHHAIESLPAGFDVKLVWADADSLGNATFAGGADNAPALLQAWDSAAEMAGNNAIVWVHNPQRVLLSPVDELRKRWERPYGPTLYSVPIFNGADEIEKQLDGIDEVRPVVRTGLLQNDLENLFAQLTGRVKTLQVVRASKKLDKRKEMSGAQTSDHLARLWANDEVARILAPRDESLTAEARSLAIQYQLVTPVTGAVVLETAEQYRASGLQPVNAGTVPTIPEPGMVALLIVAGAFLIWLFYMKHRKQGRRTCTL